LSAWVLQENDNKSRYLGPCNLFIAVLGSLASVLAVQKKFIIRFETVFNVVATEHKSCRIMLVGTAKFTLINISVRNSVFAYLFKKKLLSAAHSGLKCETHIFYVQKAYLKGNVFINIWIVPFSS